MNIKKILLSLAMVGALTSQATASDDVKAQLAFGRASAAKQEQLADELMARDADVRGRLASKHAGADVPPHVVQAITADSEGAIVGTSTVEERVLEVDALFGPVNDNKSLYSKAKVFLDAAKQEALEDLALQILTTTPNASGGRPDMTLDPLEVAIHAAFAGAVLEADADGTIRDVDHANHDVTVAARDNLVAIFKDSSAGGDAEVRGALLALEATGNDDDIIVGMRNRAIAIAEAKNITTLLHLLTIGAR